MFNIVSYFTFFYFFSWKKCDSNVTIFPKKTEDWKLNIKY